MKLLIVVLGSLLATGALAKDPQGKKEEPLPLTSSLENYKAVLAAIEEQSGIKTLQIKSIKLAGTTGKVEFLSAEKKCTSLPVEVVAGTQTPKVRFTTSTMGLCD